MAVGSYLIWIALFSCVFQASDNRHVNTFVGLTGNSDVDQILSKIPIILPEGIDPKHVNVTSITIKTCTGMKEQLAQLKQQLEQTTLLNSKLDKDTFELRRDVRLLKVQLATCSSTASAITGSYQTQLQNKMKQLLETFDSDTFLILKTIALTREVNALQKKVNNAANVTETTAEIKVLQGELQDKTAELNLKMQQIERSHINSSLILQIISLQNQIWDLEQVKSKRGDTGLQPDQRILALEQQLNTKLSQLQGNRDTVSGTLQLIAVHSKIAMIQRLISVHIEESRTNTADYQRQWRLKVELLKKKIVQLSRDENNSELTTEILDLQAEVNQLRQLMLNAKRTADSQLREIRVILEEEKKKQEVLQKQLEEADYVQAQQIMKIISTMKEVRELQVDEKDLTTPTTTTTLQALLQTKEREYAKAQAEITELQKKLQLKRKECSRLEERYEHVKTEFEQKIAELNSVGDSKAALILNVINLHDELRTLRELISTTDDPDRISKLQWQLEEKQEELKSKTTDIERLIANPKIILTIIELQNEIWDLEKKAANETSGDSVKELQNRVDGLITEIDDKGHGNTKLVLKILSLQSQVEQLRRQLSDLQMSQRSNVTQLRKDLTTKQNELQKYVDELNEKNQTNTKLVLTITDLHNQLRNLENERHNDDTASSSTITKLREQLKVTKEERSRDQAEIKALQTLLQTKEREHAVDLTEIKELQKKLHLKTEECSGLEERYEHVKTEFEQKIAELNSTGDSKAALILNVISLHDELRSLRELISTTDDPDKISELQKQVDKKQEELNSKTTDLERLIANPNIILTIIELQNEIWDLGKNATSETDIGQVKVLQNRVDGLMTEIDDNSDGNTKLVLKILTLQNQVEQLQRQLSGLKVLQTAQATQLRKDLTTKQKELQKYVDELNEKNQRNAGLILTVTDLQNQLRNLETEKNNEGRATSATITKLREQLKEKVEEHTRDQAEIKALQNQLNQTEAQCSNFEQRLKDVQNDLDAKIKDLQSKSDSVTSLALQVSTLTLQVEELKRQLQNTESETKIKELQKIIDEKTAELDKKTEELNERSAQPQRLLQIIAIQTEIEKLVNVAVNDTDYNKIKALQDHLDYLIDGIQDENNENTKLMFQVLAQQDEIARLKKQEESQTKADLEKIKELENELEDVRSLIKEKMLRLDSSDVRISNLSAQIMNLHKKLKPLEDEISYLKVVNAENLEELKKRLNLSKRQLQDSELRLKTSDAKNFDLIMEIADLRAQLKKAQILASKVTQQNINEFEQQIETEQRKNKKLENSNADLKQEVKELKLCCSDANTQCDDLQKQLQQSQEDAVRLQQQLHEKDANLKQLQQELEEKNKENDILKNENSKLEGQQEQTQDGSDSLLRRLAEKDDRLNQLQQELEEQTRANNRLQDDYNNLLDQRNKLEDDVQDLQNKLSDVEETTIHTRKVTLDPNTANPRIVLSADDTEISTSADMQNVQDNPGRFDVVLAVLGKTGYSFGRNYWEVSVAGKNCFHLGMASESAPRKGSIRFSPANGFWTIVLNKQGQYRAIDGRGASIPVQTQPLTLGIMLDYKKGQVSFYDAGTRAHMYSFVGQKFTDKIYPFINFCVEDAESLTKIVLLTPGSTDWIK